jgi:choline kinase
MKIIFQNDRFARVSKTIDKNEAKAQSMGLVAVSGEKYRQAFRNSLEQMIRNRMVNSFWHDIFNDLAAKTINVETVWINKKWQEFDNCRDIEKFLKFN